MAVKQLEAQEQLRLIEDIGSSKKFSWKTFVKALELYVISL